MPDMPESIVVDLYPIEAERLLRLIDRWSAQHAPGHDHPDHHYETWSGAVNFWLKISDAVKSGRRARHYQSYPVTIRTELEHRIWRDIHQPA